MLQYIPERLRPLIVLALMMLIFGLGAWYLYGGPTPLQIAFMSDRDGNLESYLMYADGSGQVNLTNHPAADGAMVWSEALKLFAFISTRNGGQPLLFTMSRQGGEQQLLLAAPPADVGLPQWSPNGRLLAFTSGGASADVYILNPVSGDLHNVTNHPGQERFGDWSPDSQEILFTSDRDGLGAIYKVRTDGEGLIRLTDPETPNALPSWSPDGQYIAFLSARDENIEIYVMEADGSNERRLTNDPGFDSFPRWSPNSQMIAFLSDRTGNVDIFAVTLEGDEIRNLTDAPSQEAVQGDFAWSPDGKQIIFSSDRNDNVDIYVMNADGSETRNLSNSPGVDFAPLWLR